MGTTHVPLTVHALTALAVVRVGFAVMARPIVKMAASQTVMRLLSVVNLLQVQEQDAP